MKEIFKITSYENSKSGKSINVKVKGMRIYLPKKTMVNPGRVEKQIVNSRNIIFDVSKTIYKNGWYRVEEFELNNQVPLKKKPKFKNLLELEMGWSPARVKAEIEEYANDVSLKVKKIGSKWRIEDPQNGFLITFATFRERYAFYKTEAKKIYIDLNDWGGF